MYQYIKGIIIETGLNFIVLDNNGIGYFVMVSDSSKFKLNDTVLVYIYQYVREDEMCLYGFLTKDEKDMFLKLINVKGLGCKMALPMLSGSINNLSQAIEQGDVSYLKKFPKIGDKVARQIILDLKGKLNINDDVSDNDFNDIIDALKGLGYKSVDIKKILPSINKDISIQDQIKEALKLLSK